jgi:hypothetical protein
MRVTSLIVLLILLGGIGFVFIHGPTREKFFGGAKEAKYQAKGYSLAKTPTEAMEKFLKAVQERSYGAAARYCSGEYARKLEEADTAGSSIGDMLDKIGTLLDEKGLKSDKAAFLIFKLDPFPPLFKFGGVSHKEGDEKAVGWYLPEAFPPPVVQNQEVDQLDWKMLQNNLVPNNLFTKFEIKKDQDAWKIAFGPRLEDMGHFVKNYRSYSTSLESFRDEVRQGRFLKDQIFPELGRVLAASK